MKELSSTKIIQGKVWLPVEVRKILHLEKDGEVTFLLDGEEIILRKSDTLYVRKFE